MATPLVSVIIPAYNAEDWLDECLESICDQTYRPLEVSIYNDASTDSTGSLLAKWVKIFQEQGIRCLVEHGKENIGAGGAKNIAINQAHGSYLCLQDSDDVMLPGRIEAQYKAALEHPEAIIGGRFIREPPGSQERYSKWLNAMTQEELISHQYREVTLIQPTWFMHRSVFERVGGYMERSEARDDLIASCDATLRQLPDDLLFFHMHLDVTPHDKALYRVDEDVLVYRYHPGSVSTQIPRRALLRCRLRAFERRVLRGWDEFTIWGAGRDGRNFFNDLVALDASYKRKVRCFCDIDEKKIGTAYVNSRTKTSLPIIHFKDAIPPLVCCVALDRTDGDLEANIRSLGLAEMIEYWQFS